MVNALCNHHILPHDGRHITKEMAVNALTSSLNLSEHISAVFASHAVNMNPDKTAHSFDLDHLNKHGDIEHDVSLSRNDYGFGDNHSYNPDIWANVMATYGKQAMTDFETVSKARYDRVRACKEAHEEAGVDFQYGIKELILSYGESALLLGILGDPENGRIPVQYLRVLFGMLLFLFSLSVFLHIIDRATRGLTAPRLQKKPASPTPKDGARTTKPSSRRT